MDESCRPGRANPSTVDPVNRSRHDASIPIHDRSIELDHKGRTAAERHALFMKGFTNILQHEGLRSPGYYHDKSQCISFQECSPAEMGIIKAERLKWGYVEPKELAKRLRQLKPSHSFTPQKYRPPQMLWDESPIPATPRIEDLPEADWFFWQDDGIRALKRRLGDSLTKTYLDEARKYWERVCDIDIAPVPDIYLLTHINHSPSGTLFPRSLVKALFELLASSHKRGLFCYYDKFNYAKRRREEAIRQWEEEHPDKVLAKDALSIYRTWPAELMARLNEVYREAIREGRRLYMADLETTGQKMQELVTFWRDCGLVTGTRTPPSPQWPDPKAKLHGIYGADYLYERLDAIHIEFGHGNNEGDKREMIERARWKEAVLNMDSDPMVSELPLTQPLSQKLDIVWKGYESLKDYEFVEDAMIDVLGRWRSGEKDEPCSGTSSPPALIDLPCSRLSRTDARALTDGLRFLGERSSNKRKPRDCHNRFNMNSGAWLGRLRPRSEPHCVLRRDLRTLEKPRKSSQRVMKSRDSKPSVKHLPISQVGKARVSETLAISSCSQHSPIATPQILPSATIPKRTAAQRSSEHDRNGKPQSFVQGLQKASKVQSKSLRKRRRSGSDESTRKCLHLLTPPTSK